MSSDTINSLCIIVLAATIVLYNVKDVLRDRYQRKLDAAKAAQFDNFTSMILSDDMRKQEDLHARRQARKAHRMRIAKRRFGVAR